MTKTAFLAEESGGGKRRISLGACLSMPCRA